MIKATITQQDGRTVLMIGLSFGNLDRFRAQPLDTFIPISGADMGLSVDVLLFSAESEGDLQRFLADRVGPETQVYIDPSVAT